MTLPAASGRLARPIRPGSKGLSISASRTDAVADRLRDEILRGTWRPGQRLPGERDMAERLGVNRSSVREALQRLAQLGLVDTRRGGGTTVRHLHEASLEVARHLLFVDGVADRARIAQLLDVHEMLVSGAARLAVERGSDDEMLHARELVARLGDRDAGPEELASLFDEMVELITRASGNLVLRLCRNALRPVLADDLKALRPLLRPATDRHAPLLAALDAALSARDAAATEEAVRRLLRDRRERLLAALERLPEPIDRAPHD